MIEFTHSQLSEVFLHGQESTVRGAFYMFIPGTEKKKTQHTEEKCSTDVFRKYCKTASQ